MEFLTTTAIGLMIAILVMEGGGIIIVAQKLRTQLSNVLIQ